MSDNNEKSLWFLVGLLVGGAIGAAVGILSAPKSGTEMRNELSEGFFEAQNKTRQILEDAKVGIEESLDKASKNLDDTVKRMSDAFGTGKKAALDEIEKVEEKIEDEKTEENKES